VDLIALFEQKFGEIAPVLSGNAGDERCGHYVDSLRRDSGLPPFIVLTQRRPVEFSAAVDKPRRRVYIQVEVP
jgi:hypothetical protein